MDFPRIVSGRELLSIFESLSPDPAGADRVERVIGEVGGNWALKRVPLKLISFSTGSVEAPSSQRLLRRYSKMQTPMPPVILDEFHHGGTEFEIVDGFHRIAVAQQRGDKDVLAYVPIGDKTSMSTTEPASSPQHPVVAKLLRVLPLANRLLPQGMKLAPANDPDGLPVVQVLSGQDPLNPIRLGAITFFSTGEDMEWFYKLYGQVPYSLNSGMVYLTYLDETSRAEEPAGLLNLGDEDDTWAERLVTILGLPGASPELPVAPATGEGPTPWHHPIINMKPMPIETPFWFRQDGGMRQYEPASKLPIVSPGFKLPDSLWPTGWQPGQPIQQAVEAKAKPLPESAMPTQGDDFALTDDKKLTLKRFEGKALRADSFQDFQELLNKILLELELTEGYRKSVAGILNRSRKQKGYDAL